MPQAEILFSDESFRRYLADFDFSPAEVAMLTLIFTRGHESMLAADSAVVAKLAKREASKAMGLSGEGLRKAARRLKKLGIIEIRDTRPLTYWLNLSALGRTEVIDRRKLRKPKPPKPPSDGNRWQPLATDGNRPYREEEKYSNSRVAVCPSTEHRGAGCQKLPSVANADQTDYGPWTKYRRPWQQISDADVRTADIRLARWLWTHALQLGWVRKGSSDAPTNFLALFHHASDLKTNYNAARVLVTKVKAWDLKYVGLPSHDWAKQVIAAQRTKRQMKTEFRVAVRSVPADVQNKPRNHESCHEPT